MNKFIFRIDDIGASTKEYNQHGYKWLKVRGKKIFYFPLANLGFFKRITPFKGWAKYAELTVSEWRGFLDIFAKNNIVPIIAVTATWVEKDSRLTPFPKKFPEAANFLKEAFAAGKIVIANHGLTHCVVGKHLPRFWGSNRQFHREFLPELDQRLHDEHILKSQKILEDFFGRPIKIFVPPGNLWSYKTYLALKKTALKTVMSNRYMADSNDKMDGISFIPDEGNSFAFHDRELKLYGEKWLIAQILNNKNG